MHILGGLLVLIQILFAIHAVRRGNNQWVSFILFVPAVGCAVYFFTEVLPELRNDPRTRKAVNSLAKAADPRAGLRRRKQDLEFTDNIDNRIRLASECEDIGFVEEALEIYVSCQTGIHEYDPDIMLSRARCEFALDQFGQARNTLEELIARNPDFKSYDGHLLYTRTLENAGDQEQALIEYAELIKGFPGEEARARYGLLLQSFGEQAAADEQFEAIISRSMRAPKHYQQKEKQWIDIARRSGDFSSS